MYYLQFPLQTRLLMHAIDYGGSHPDWPSRQTRQEKKRIFLCRELDMWDVVLIMWAPIGFDRCDTRTCHLPSSFTGTRWITAVDTGTISIMYLNAFLLCSVLPWSVDDVSASTIIVSEIVKITAIKIMVIRYRATFFRINWISNQRRAAVLT